MSNSGCHVEVSNHYPLFSATRDRSATRIENNSGCSTSVPLPARLPDPSNEILGFVNLELSDSIYDDLSVIRPPRIIHGSSWEAAEGQHERPSYGEVSHNSLQLMITKNLSEIIAARAS